MRKMRKTEIKHELTQAHYAEAKHMENYIYFYVYISI